MKYNIDRLKLRYKSQHEIQDAIDFLFFNSDMSTGLAPITNNWLSQWWIAPFTVEGTIYQTAEHWMMFQKAMLFGDKEIAEEVIRTKSPDDIKTLGRKIRGFVESVWNEHKLEIVLHGNYYKFLQNESLLYLLLGTKTAILAEASPVDNIWGIGKSAEDKDINNPLLWPGENLLGFALMEIRDLLKDNYENRNRNG